MKLIKAYFRSLYQRTMRESYAFARSAIRDMPRGSIFLDCGCYEGDELLGLAADRNDKTDQYAGIEWNEATCALARAKGVNAAIGDLNRPFPVASNSQDCVYGLSVLEHLLMPCAFITECRRVLRPGGRLVLLTPNISTYFTALLVLLGRMPSSGPHPDSLALLSSEEVVQLHDVTKHDSPDDHPVHRHLVVFSFLVLKKFLEMSGFEIESARGFGLYPLPNFLQPLAERIDPYHCHQMVFVCRKK